MIDNQTSRNPTNTLNTTLDVRSYVVIIREISHDCEHGYFTALITVFLDNELLLNTTLSGSSWHCSKYRHSTDRSITLHITQENTQESFTRTFSVTTVFLKSSGGRLESSIEVYPENQLKQLSRKFFTGFGGTIFLLTIVRILQLDNDHRRKQCEYQVIEARLAKMSKHKRRLYKKQNGLK